MRSWGWRRGFEGRCRVLLLRECNSSVFDFYSLVNTHNTIALLSHRIVSHSLRLCELRVIPPCIKVPRAAIFKTLDCL